MREIKQNYPALKFRWISSSDLFPSHIPAPLPFYGDKCVYKSRYLLVLFIPIHIPQSMLA